MFRRETHEKTGRNRGIVDHDTGCLSTCLEKREHYARPLASSRAYSADITHDQVIGELVWIFAPRRKLLGEETAKCSASDM
jgi:hypothetical protein